MRTPLIVISTKSLLRNPNAVSTINELTDGSFACEIDDQVKDQSKVKKALMCSGSTFTAKLASSSAISKYCLLKTSPRPRD